MNGACVMVGSRRATRRMLGYIERTPNGFELVKLQHRPEWEKFGTLKEALDVFVDLSDAEADRNA
jgi:hypothetical protein